MGNVEREEFYDSSMLKEREITINFKMLFMELLDKALVIILVGALSALSSCCIYNFLVKNYVSTTKIYVLPQSQETNLNYLDLEMGTRLTADYIEIIRGRDVVEKVIDYFQMDVDYEDFLKKLDVENSVDTRIISISYRYSDPIVAHNVVARLRNIALEQIEVGMEIEGISIIEEANLPVEPEFPPVLVGIVAAFLMMVVAAGVVVVRYLVVDRVVTAEDVEKRLGLIVLGAIMYDEKRNGGRRR